MKLQKLQMEPTEKKQLEDQIRELEEENKEIRAAADRNAAKFTKIARFNRQYIEKNQSLLKEKKELIIGRDDLMEKNAILAEQVKHANEAKEIRAAADLNCSKFAQVARQNADYINEIRMLRGAYDLASFKRKRARLEAQPDSAFNPNNCTVGPYLKFRPRIQTYESDEETTAEQLPIMATSRSGRQLKKPVRFIENY